MIAKASSGKKIIFVELIVALDRPVVGAMLLVLFEACFCLFLARFNHVFFPEKRKHRRWRRELQYFDSYSALFLMIYKWQQVFREIQLIFETFYMSYVTEFNMSLGIVLAWLHEQCFFLFSHLSLRLQIHSVTCKIYRPIQRKVLLSQKEIVFRWTKTVHELEKLGR